MQHQRKQTIELKDVILDIAQLKRKEAELLRETDSVRNEILKKENFLYDMFQNESIQQARQARQGVSPPTKADTPEKPTK